MPANAGNEMEAFMDARKKNTSSAGRSKRKANDATDPCLLINLDELLTKLRDDENAVGRRKGGTSGCKGQVCRGVGRGSHYVPAARCPNPCDETQYTDNAHEVAKKAAKRAANMNCIDLIIESDCRCENGNFRFLRKECIEIAIAGTKYCAYDVYYEYKGECRP